MKVLTANRLSDGEAVWLAQDHGWAETIDASEVARDKDHEARLESIGKDALLANKVIDVNLIDVQIVEGRVVPLRLRERIRADGPSNRTDLGKQARPRIAVAA